MEALFERAQAASSSRSISHFSKRNDLEAPKAVREREHGVGGSGSGGAGLGPGGSGAGGEPASLCSTSSAFHAGGLGAGGDGILGDFRSATHELQKNLACSQLAESSANISRIMGVLPLATRKASSIVAILVAGGFPLDVLSNLGSFQAVERDLCSRQRFRVGVGNGALDAAGIEFWPGRSWRAARNRVSLNQSQHGRLAARRRE